MTTVQTAIVQDLAEQAFKVESRKNNLQSELTNIQKQLDSLGPGRHNIHKKKELQKRYSELTKELSSVVQGTQTNEICQKYSKYMQSAKTTSLDQKNSSKKCIYSGNVNPDALSPNTKTVNANLIMEEYKRDPKLQTSAVYTLPHMKCSTCGVNMHKLIDASVMVCPKCSMSCKFLDSSSKSLGFHDEVEYVTMSYQRQNHFQEWLNSFQGRENTVIPDHVIQKVMKEIAEMGVRDPSKITRKQVRKALKVYKLRNYYSNITSIMCRITGQKPIRFLPVFAEKLKLLFMMVQRPFNKHCPPSRKNFLSYSDIFYKFCEIEGETKYLPHFELLKGPEKQYRFDMTWQKICEDVDLPFIPSV